MSKETALTHGPDDGSEVDNSYDIAIIGMTGRFPGANDLDTFWQNLRRGVESVTFFSDEELQEAGYDPSLLSNPDFVKAAPVLDKVELFDANFFDIPAREAAAMDPQQRLFLECAWEALEAAGYNAEKYPGSISVYAGVSVNTYILLRLRSHADDPTELFQLLLANDKDFLATRVSYKLNLRGESVTIQTACSTSLVAVNLACQSLLSGQSDMALAGGVSIRVPTKRGYLYSEGMIGSPDGHCRAFDEKAGGTLVGDGVGVVVLKLLSEALKDGDFIHAVIKGSAINNDGRLKMGYTAPSVAGQVEVISRAQAMACINPETITYVEAHGTGTSIGDPIEVEALTKAFRQQTNRKRFCALGALKANTGHLDAAAGVAGLIKTALVLKHREIPPVVHFSKPNPAIDFENSPFYINTTLLPWDTGTHPRRAAVSSFGIGGTNAHVILEEAPAAQPSSQARPWQLLTLSAKTSSALKEMTAQLAAHLEKHPQSNLADVAFTRNAGRQSFTHKNFVVARTPGEAVERLRAVGSPARTAALQFATAPRVAFMFPGQGSQYVGMARELYEHEPLFRQQVDDCARLLQASVGQNIRELIYPPAERMDEAAARLRQPEFTLPALFAIEYALAQLWMSWGIKPQAMIGHSFGEYVAACLAGVFTLEDALKLAAARGRLMQRLPDGCMTAVSLSEAQAQQFLTNGLSVAAVNSRHSCVVTGEPSGMLDLERKLADREIGFRRLDVPYAYHSPMLDPLLAEYTALVAAVPRRAPSIPFISNVSGNWISSEEATSPQYWATQMRQKVRFSAGLDTLTNNNFHLFLEAGPNRALHSLVKQHLNGDALVTASTAKPGASAGDLSVMLDSLGQLWSTGVEVDWQGFYEHEERQRLPLPTYPFERQRYWLEARPMQIQSPAATAHQPSSAAAATASATARAEVEAAPTPLRHQVQRSRMTQPYVAPRNETEETLAAIWGEVLGLTGIGIDDDFFSLGGDSLLITQIYSRIKQTFAVNISLQQMLTVQTISDFARLLQSATVAGAEHYQPIMPVARKGRLPLSFAQQRLWFVDQFEPGSAAFNIAMSYRVTGRFDVNAVEQSLNAMVVRHESLRTIFPIEGGLPHQHILQHLKLAVPVTDLRPLSATERESEAQRLIEEEARRPFDLTRGPLVRVSLLQLDEAEHVLLLTMHHIISDSWSMGVFITEMVACYEAFMRGEEPRLPPLPIQYADFAVWQREWLQGAVLDEQLSFWKQQLSDAPPVLALPTDYPRPAVQSYGGGREPITIPAALVRELKSLCQDAEVTLFMLLLAAYQMLLHRHTGQEDIVVGTDIANRNRIETESLIGFFINQLVLRTDLSGDPSFLDLLGRVREVVVGAFAHQDFPFDKLVDALKPERQSAFTPLFQVKLVLQNVPLTMPEIPDLKLRSQEVDTGTSQFDLILNLFETEQGLVGEMYYKTDLFKPESVARLVGEFQLLLEQITLRPAASLSELEATLAEHERQRLQRDEQQLAALGLQRLKSVKRKVIDIA